jgi:hypothetical protein
VDIDRGDVLMSALWMMLRPIRHGWAVQLSDGRELARFLGPGARWRATRYLRRAVEALKTGATPGAATI